MFVLLLFFKWHSWILHLLKSIRLQKPSDLCTTNYSRTVKLQCPPLTLPNKKIKGKKENISPTPHRVCLTPGKTCKSYSLKKYTPANFKAFIQHSCRAQSITKRLREEWEKCWLILGSLWLVYHFSHRTRYRDLLSGFAFPVGHLLPNWWQQEL